MPWLRYKDNIKNVIFLHSIELALANDQLDAQFLIHLLQFSTCTCFE